MINDYLDNIYKESGSYLASAEIQQSIDYNMFLAFLDGNVEILKRFDEEAYKKIDREAMKKVAEKSGPIKEWLDKNYFSVYDDAFGQFDHSPDKEEVENSLINFIKKDPYNLFNGFNLVYNAKIKPFVDELNKSNASITQKSSNLIAYEVSAADYLIFNTLIESAGLYEGYDDLDVIINFKRFMMAVEPTAK